jgi:hypothetical protein
VGSGNKLQDLAFAQGQFIKHQSCSAVGKDSREFIDHLDDLLSAGSVSKIR